MPFPAARVGDLTVTGDAITGPGAPTVLIGGQPAALMGDSVSGAACTGAIIGGSPTVLICSRPAARLTSAVSGANPITGIPVATTVGIGCPTVLIP